MKRNNSLRENLVDFLIENPSHLKQVYEAFPGEKETTIRGRLNENLNKCFKRIGRGIYLATCGNAQALIIEGDAWNEIKNIETGSIDAIITDSPYSCLNKHLSMGTTRKTKGEWSFKTKDIDENLLKEMLRVLKQGGHFFSFLPPDSKDTLDYNNNFIESARRIGFEFNKRWIWNKEVIGMGYNGRNKYEQIIFLSKGKRTKPRNLSIPDLLSYKRLNPRTRFHEAQKPNELIRDILVFCSNENDVILDPFAGSLVLAEECLNHNRNSISIEIDGEMIQSSINQRNLNVQVII